LIGRSSINGPCSSVATIAILVNWGVTTSNESTKHQPVNI
jgi:hypothetical protein